MLGVFGRILGPRTEFLDLIRKSRASKNAVIFAIQAIWRAAGRQGPDFLLFLPAIFHHNPTAFNPAGLISSWTARNAKVRNP